MVQLYEIPIGASAEIPGPIHGFRFVQAGQGATWRLGSDGPLLPGHGRGSYEFRRPGISLTVNGSWGALPTVVEVLKTPEIGFAAAIGADDLPTDVDGAVLVGTSGGNPIHVADGGSPLSPMGSRIASAGAIADYTGISTLWTSIGDFSVPAWAKSFHVHLLCTAVSGGTNPTAGIALEPMPDSTTPNVTSSGNPPWTVDTATPLGSGFALSASMNPDLPYVATALSNGAAFLNVPILPTGKVRVLVRNAVAPVSQTLKCRAEWRG